MSSKRVPKHAVKGEPWNPNDGPSHYESPEDKTYRYMSLSIGSTQSLSILANWARMVTDLEEYFPPEFVDRVRRDYFLKRCKNDDRRMDDPY